MRPVRPRTRGVAASKPIPRTGLRRDLRALVEIRRDHVRYLTTTLETHGDIVRIRLLGIPLVVMNHPDYVQHVLVTHHENYDKETFLYRLVRPVLRDGLIGAVGGEPWHRQRRLMQPSFHRPKTQAFVGNMTDETGAMLRRWEREIAPGATVDVVPHLGHLALRIVTRTLFGADIGPSTVDIERRFTEANRIMGNFFRFPFPPLTFPTPSHRRLHRLIASLDDYVDDLIGQRRDQREPAQDLLSVLASAVDEETGRSMTSDQLHQEVLNVMVGGYETTTNAAAWLFERISERPDVQDRLQDEVDAVLSGCPPTFEDLSRLTYTRMVVDETLRLNTPAWQTMRRAVHDDEVGGYHVPASAGVYINLLTLHRHPDFWPAPDRFDPDRFLPENVAQRPRNAYLPFGSGPRICIGKHFAVSELQVMLAMVVQRYRLRRPPGRGPVPMRPMVTLRPGGGVPLKLVPR